MSDPTWPAFPVFAFLGFTVSLIPLPWHLQAWNSGTCFFMLWTAIACLNLFVNSIIWADNVLNSFPVWCDISIRITLGASVGIPASSLCIMRRLYYISNVYTGAITHAEKKKAILVDTLICALFPIIFIALQYIVQGHRFNIYEGVGCYPDIFNTLLAFFISDMWPIIIGLISATYCALSLRAFFRRRAQFQQFMSSNKTLTVSRYLRLMALAMTEILCTTPIAIFVIWLNASAEPVQPWISWSNVHINWSRVEQVPAFIWRQNYLFTVSVELTRWATPFCALVFFAFFGFADEAKRHYWLLCVFIRDHIYLPRLFSVEYFSKRKLSDGSDGSLPIYAGRPSVCCASDKVYASKLSVTTLSEYTTPGSKSMDLYPETDVSVPPSGRVVLSAIGQISPVSLTGEYHPTRPVAVS